MQGMFQNIGQNYRVERSRCKRALFNPALVNRDAIVLAAPRRARRIQFNPFCTVPTIAKHLYQQAGRTPNIEHAASRREVLRDSIEVTLILRPKAIFGGAISSEFVVIIAGIALIKEFRLRNWIGE